jgi:PAS domain-containing protein
MLATIGPKPPVFLNAVEKLKNENIQDYDFSCGSVWVRNMMFENRVLRRIFGLKRDEVTGGWRKLHNEEPHDLYSSPSIIRITKLRRMRWVEHVARMGEKRNACRLLVG